MPRYIIIDQNSGYVWGDSADFAANQSGLTPIEACRLLDESVGAPGREYEETSGLADTGYAIYRADINGSEAVPVIWDGQDQETINAVMRDCDLVTHVKWAEPE